MTLSDTEIERRFKLRVPAHDIASDSEFISQWYLPRTGSWASRCRITTPVGGSGVSTYDYTKKRDETELKVGMTQEEFSTMKKHCFPIGVEKQRYNKPVDPYLWQLDVFRNLDLQGLSIAEVEIPSWDAPLAIPDWIGTELTGVRCFSNVSLCRFLNRQDEREAAMAHVVAIFKLDPSLIEQFGTLKVSSRLRPPVEGFPPLDVRFLIHTFLDTMNVDLVLNSMEKNWLLNDENITFLELTIMTTFIKRKLFKIEEKVKNIKS